MLVQLSLWPAQKGQVGPSFVTYPLIKEVNSPGYVLQIIHGASNGASFGLDLVVGGFSGF